MTHTSSKKDPRWPWLGVWPAWLALLAALLSVDAWALLGLGLEGYQLWAHPFALPGARGLPGAGVFNVLVFMLPGALLAGLALCVRQRLPEAASWRLRLGCALALLAALGWVGQGLWPLDVSELDAGSSRWHALAWMLWRIAAASAALLMAVPGVRGMRGWSVALVVALLLPEGVPAGSVWAILAQPAAVLVWGLWMGALVHLIYTKGDLLLERS